MSKHRSKIVRLKRGARIGEAGAHPKVESKKAYHEELDALQLQLLQIQRAYHRNGQRAMVVFQGWDASGKGGAIRRLTEKLDPRGVRVHSIAAPSEEERSRHHLWRFWQRVPIPGRIAIFDRSWYGRVLVERVEGFASKAAWKRAYDELNEFEHTLIDDGVRIVKFFVHIDPEEQLRRFEERLRNPYKRWKLTVEDIRNRERWGDYEEAVDDMLEKTSTRCAPWNVVLGNHKWHARLDVLRNVVLELGRGIDLDEPVLDPEVREAIRTRLGLSIND